MWEEEAITILQSALSGLFRKEENRLDWKVALSENRKRLYEHVSAFANYPGGGYLVFGINDKTGEVTNKIDPKIVSKISNMARDGMDPPVLIDHKFVSYGKGKILIFKITESMEKPVHLRGKSVEFSFIRSGGETRKMSRQDIKEAYITSGSLQYEKLITVNDLDEKRLRDYLDVESYIKLRQQQRKSTEPELELLKKDGLVERLGGGKYGITNLGMLLAAKDFALFGKGSFDVRIIGYSDESKLNAVSEKRFEGGYAINFENILGHVIGLLPHSEVIRDALRVTQPVYPIVSMRELLANALVHQSFYRDAGNVLIELFPDRISFTNPGRLLPSIKIDQLINAHPQSRNEELAKHMRLMGICEERGSGIDRAVFEVELYGLPAIEFSQLDDFFRATIFAPKDYRQMTLEERVMACYQHASLMRVTGKKMTRVSLIKRLNIPYAVAASRLIKETMSEGLIKVGNQKNKAKKLSFYLPYWA